MNGHAAGFKTVLKEAAEHMGGQMGRKRLKAARHSLMAVADRPLKEVVRGDWALSEDEASLLAEAINVGRAARLD